MQSLRMPCHFQLLMIKPSVNSGNWGDLQTLNGSATTLQWSVLRAMLAARQKKLDTDDKLVTKMAEGSMVTVSFRAAEKDLDEKNFGRRLLAVASAFLELACFFVNLLINMVINLCNKSGGAIEPILLLVKLRYDETPTKVRVQDPAIDLRTIKDSSSATDPVQSELAASETSTLHAKILQVECGVGILSRHRNTDQCTYMSASVPSTLMALESTSGDHIEAALMRVIGCVGL